LSAERTEIVMQHRESRGQGKSSAAVAGLGAALVAAAITLTMMMGNPSPAAISAPAAPPANQCQNMPLMVLVTGSGTVRFREGGYLSPAITLSDVPQTVVFPRPRSETTPIEEVITIEGNATDVVTTSPITQARNLYPKVNGVLAIDARWRPFKRC
jgi:hypothetical protein